MKRKRNKPEFSPRSIAACSFLIASFAYMCAALARLSEGRPEGGITAVLLVLGVVNLCLFLIQHALIHRPWRGPDGRKRKNTAKKYGERGRRPWRS